MRTTFRLAATGLCAVACFALATVTSCDKAEEPGADNATTALRFAATADNVPATRGSDAATPQTRGTDYNTGNLPSLGVFASLTSGDFTSSSATANYMYNQKVTRSGSTWTYTPMKYWPNNGTDKLSFFAYAPHNAAGLSFPEKTATGFPSLIYAVPATEAAQTDLLASPPLMNRTQATAGSSGVSFAMKHTLTKVIFRVNNKAGAVISVSGFGLTGRASGTLMYHATTSGGDKGFSWSGITGNATFTGKASSAAPVNVPVPATGSTDVPPVVATFYLLPDGSASTFSITYTITGSSAKTVNDIALSSGIGWAAGTAVAYTMTIEPDNISVVTATVDDSGKWGDDGSTTATTKKYPIFGPDDLKPGDFYYSDGSWSDGGCNYKYSDDTTGDEDVQPVLTNPETGAGRSVIGIVYWVGDVTGDNYGLLKKKNGEAFSGGTHGLVVALWSAKDPATSLEKITWSHKEYDYIQIRLSTIGVNVPSGYILDEREKRQGYINTLVLEKYNENVDKVGYITPSDYLVTPIEALAAFRNEHPAPESSSGWYWPSVCELKDVCWGQGATDQATDGKTMLDKQINKVSGGTLFGDERYWSSTEYKDMGGMWSPSVLFNNGMVNGYEAKIYANCNARFLLAF